MHDDIVLRMLEEAQLTKLETSQLFRMVSVGIIQIH